MFELFKWGFLAATILTWIALGVGALMLLLPAKSTKRAAAIVPEEKRAA